jgi:nitrate/nitrite-specific signal transduction histidine kinase
MRERADLMGAELVMRGMRKHGAEVRLAVPLSGGERAARSPS